jgi:preprotein translocase subunit SecD
MSRQKHQERQQQKAGKKVRAVRLQSGWYARMLLIVGLSVGAWFILWPSISGWVPAPAWVSKTFARKISPGLDIKGGLRLVYEVEVDQAVRDRRDVLADQMLERVGEKLGVLKGGGLPSREELQRVRERVKVTKLGDRRMSLVFTQPADAKKLDRDTVTKFGDLREISREGATVVLQITDDRLEHLRATAVEQAVKTISDRIDELQVRETTVMGRENDIIVEIPGADEAMFNRIRSIISRTARLDFKIVDDDTDFVATLQDLPAGIERMVETVSAGPSRPQATVSYLVAKGDSARQRLVQYIQDLEKSGRVPDDHQFTIGKHEGGGDAAAKQELSWRTYYLFARAEITGDSIDDALVSYDSQDNGKPVVSLQFGSSGADVFEELTGRNIKRRMAIVLDDRVESAPVIQARIGGGRAQITLGSFLDYQTLVREANDLVVVLRAGALPAPIRPANEQLIGPTLGRDSVQQGAMGALVGIGLALVFMALYYQLVGLVADVMVVLNILFLLAVLAFFEATLTLPGIAGIALTVGMALDANVLITERIREELALGKAARAAVEQGYDRAYSSILDSQLTTLIAGIVLFQYGTGPIKGFAVTLMVGIVTSLFTGVFCSKVMMDWLVRGLRIEKLPVG